MRKLGQSSKGFTLVELMLATTFFSFVMLFTVLGFMQINRTYHRGVLQKDIQNATRVVVEDIADQIRSASAGSISVERVTDGDSNYRLCIGSVRYGFSQHIGTTSSDNTFHYEIFNTPPPDNSVMFLARDPDPSHACDSPIDRFSAGTVSLLDLNLLVQYIDLEQIGTTNTYRLTVVISTDDLTDFETFGLDAKCRVGASDQFCFVSKLETAITTRN